MREAKSTQISRSSEAIAVGWQEHTDNRTVHAAGTRDLVWWHIPAILPLWRLKEDGSEFQASLGYKNRLVSQKGKQ